MKNLATAAFAAAVAATALTLAPIASAQPDPFIPNGDAGWCPGGDIREQISGGSRYCLGQAYPDGSHYTQRWMRADVYNPFSYRWSHGATCNFLSNGLIQGGRPYNADGSGGGRPQCGGGPRQIKFDQG